MAPPKTIGVLALQGDFLEHRLLLARLNCRVLTIKYREQLDDCDGLIMPGGESTTIGMLLQENGFEQAIKQRASEGMGVFGTCAGVILLAQRQQKIEQWRLRLLDLEIERNAYGRQVDSFEADIDLAWSEAPFRAVFIRAPKILKIGPDVEALAGHDGEIVLVRQGNILGATFHPELTEDDRVHDFFVNQVCGSSPHSATFAPAATPVTDVIDLHTFSPGETKQLLEAYLQECLESGFHHLKIIHGKGAGTQRRIVHSFLAKHPKVNEYKEAAPDAGGWGATEVWLQR